MEQILRIDSLTHDLETGKPLDKGYLERGLPPYLRASLDAWKPCMERLARSEKVPLWDCCFCELQADINAAEVEQEISHEAANYLRSKYLGIEVF